MYEIFQRLHANQYAEAVLPVAIRSGQLDERQYLNNDYLLFPMLQDEFRMGVPLHEDDFHNYLHALTLAYKRMHSIGVVHLDGYPSNILWRKSLEGEIVIRFVDFDVASFLGHKFDSGIRNLLEGTEFSRSHYYWKESNVASEKHDAWFVYMFSKMTMDERRASSDAASRKDVGGVNSNYWKLVHRVRSSCDYGDRAQFNTWFLDTWKNFGEKVDK
jgi:serine/threonine protein kinase